MAHDTADDLRRVREAIPETALIGDPVLRDAVESIWQEAWRASTWDDVTDVPKNPSATSAPQRVEDAWTLVTHTRAVAQLALASAETVKALHGIDFDRDALLVLAILHDVSKLLEYEGTRTAITKTRHGELIQHGVHGAFLMWQHGLPVELVHGVISHTPSSNVLPQTHEALVVRYVDFLDTDSMLLDAGEKLFLS